MREQLELYSVNDSALSNAIDGIVVKLHGYKKKSDSKVFLLTGAGANGGTTTVALNIAISLASAGWKTVFLDCDLRKDQQYKRIDNAESASLTSYLSEKNVEAKDIISFTNFDNLDYIAGGDKNDNPVRLLSNAKMEKLIEELKADYDFVIIDTPPVSINNDAELLVPFVDKYLFVVSMNNTTKKQLVKSRLQLADYEDKYIGIVANKMEMAQYKSAVKDYNYFFDGFLREKKKKGMNRKKGS